MNSLSLVPDNLAACPLPSLPDEIKVDKSVYSLALQALSFIKNPALYQKLCCGKFDKDGRYISQIAEAARLRSLIIEEKLLEKPGSLSQSLGNKISYFVYQYFKKFSLPIDLKKALCPNISCAYQLMLHLLACPEKLSLNCIGKKKIQHTYLIDLSREKPYSFYEKLSSYFSKYQAVNKPHFFGINPGSSCLFTDFPHTIHIPINNIEKKYQLKSFCHLNKPQTLYLFDTKSKKWLCHEKGKVHTLKKNELKGLEKNIGMLYFESL